MRVRTRDNGKGGIVATAKDSTCKTRQVTHKVDSNVHRAGNHGLAAKAIVTKVAPARFKIHALNGLQVTDKDDKGFSFVTLTDL